jgi:hypothetical protein
MKRITCGEDVFVLERHAEQYWDSLKDEIASLKEKIKKLRGGKPIEEDGEPKFCVDQHEFHDMLLNALNRDGVQNPSSGYILDLACHALNVLQGREKFRKAGTIGGAPLYVLDEMPAPTPSPAYNWTDMNTTVSRFNDFDLEAGRPVQGRPVSSRPEQTQENDAGGIPF